MEQRDWFEVGVRLLGVWQILGGMNGFVAFVVSTFISKTALSMPDSLLSHGLYHLLIGLFLLLGAGRVTNLIYKRVQRGFEIPPAA